jgi:D-psicose/D-tagatose/L-ribulose 3-epimerase
MRFGVSIWLWTSPVTNEVIEAYLPKIAGLGFDTVEIPIEDPASLDADRVAKAIKESGLAVTTCAAMGPGRDLLSPDESVRKETMKYMRDSIDLAGKLGSKRFVGPVYSEVGRLWKSTPEEKKAETVLLVKQLKELSEYASGKDVVLCVEGLNRFETSFVNLTSQVADIVKQVDHSNCKVMVDLFHAGIEEKNLGDAIRTAGKDLFHLQVAENDRGTPGTGQFDWDGIASALKEVGYDGDVIIETFSPDNELLAKAAAIWRPLASGPDQLAKDGLAFLKKILG